MDNDTSEGLPALYNSTVKVRDLKTGVISDMDISIEVTSSDMNIVKFDLKEQEKASG